MTDVLEIRRKPPRQAYQVLAARVATLVGGLLLLVPGILALLTQPLASDQKVTAVALVAFGGFATGLGGIRTAQGRRLVRRPVAVRLDDRGVHVLGGSIEKGVLSSLAWPDVAGVEVAPVELNRALFTPDGAMTVLRFVPRADDRIVGEVPDGFTIVKATALELTPAAATMALVQGDTSSFRVPLILDWVRRHQPGVPIDDRRS